MKSGKMPSNGQYWSKTRGASGMTSLLKGNTCSLVINWALLFDSQFKTFKGKLTTCWLGPYEVDIVYDNGAIKIKTIDDGQVSFVVNGHRLKFYHKPISREDFLQVMTVDKALALVDGEVPPCS
jgi:hypothetical protein